MTEIEKLKEQPDLFLREDGLWWSKESTISLEFLQIRQEEIDTKIIPLIPERRIVVQAGGNCGYVPKNLRRSFETVYTFEPIHSMFLALCLNNIDMYNTFKFQACLGKENTSTNMMRYHNAHNGNDFPFASGRFPIIKIDDLNLKYCDLIMLNIAGYEYYSLLGGQNTIEKHKPLLYLGRNFMPRTLGLPDFILDDKLKEWGYAEIAKIGLFDHIYQFQK